MRNVCEVEMQWVNPILKKLEKLDIKKLRYHIFFPLPKRNFEEQAYGFPPSGTGIETFFLCVWSSGGSRLSDESIEGENSGLQEKKVNVAEPLPDDSESRVQAARERFLARKANK